MQKLILCCFRKKIKQTYKTYGSLKDCFTLLFSKVIRDKTGGLVYFAGAAQTWAYFYGPVGILLTLNMIYLGLTSWRLWHRYRDYTGSKLRVLRFKCMLYIKLVLVMGITWIFELMSFAIDTNIDEFW